MDIRKEFKSQWSDIKIMVQAEMMAHLNSVGYGDAEKLTEKLQEEMSKWEKGILMRGIFFDEMRNRDYELATAFIQKSAELEFSPTVNQRLPSTWYVTLIIGILSVLCFIGLYLYTQLGLLEMVFYPILAFTIMSACAVPLRRKIRDDAKYRIFEVVADQMDNMGEELEKIVNKLE